MREILHITTLLILAPLFLTTSCDLIDTGDSDASEMHFGDWETVGNGQARAWVRLDSDDKPIALGVTMTEASLNGLPEGPEPTDYHLHLPEDISISPFNHVGLDWNPAGHPPPEVYTVPHFDVHFYLLNEETQESIEGGPASEFPAEKFVPDGYVADSVNVPNMGMHYLPMFAPEFNGQSFTHTLIYGFYQGDMAFIEPMITVDFLKNQPDISAPIRQPEVYQTTGYYPTEYTIRYDADEEVYEITLVNLTRREGS